MNVHETFRRRLLNVLCTFNLRPVSTGIPLVKDENSFYEIRSLDIYINIKDFNWVSRKQLNILKTCLEYLENGIVENSILEVA